MTPILVRLATLDDVARIAEIHVYTWQATYRGDLPDVFLDSLAPSQRESMWQQAIDNPQTHHATFVATDELDVVGFCSVGPARLNGGLDSKGDPALGELYAIYVDPSAQAKGAGSALINAATDSLLKSGFTHAILWVLEGNARARGFYEHHGWIADTSTQEAEIVGHPVIERRYRKLLAC